MFALRLEVIVLLSVLECQVFVVNLCGCVVVDILGSIVGSVFLKNGISASFHC